VRCNAAVHVAPCEEANAGKMLADRPPAGGA